MPSIDKARAMIAGAKAQDTMDADDKAAFKVIAKGTHQEYMDMLRDTGYDVLLGHRII